MRLIKIYLTQPFNSLGIILVLFFLISLVDTTQAQDINSLKASLQNKQISNEERLSLLIQVSEYLLDSSPKEAINYTNEAEKIARKGNQSQLLAEIYTLQGYLFATHLKKPVEAYQKHEKAYQAYKNLFESQQIDQWEIYSFLENYAIPTYQTVSNKYGRKRKYRKAIEKYTKLNSEFLAYLSKLTHNTKENLSNTQQKLNKIDTQLQEVDRKLGEKNTELYRKNSELRKKTMHEKKLIIDKLKLTGELEEKEIQSIALNDSLLIREIELQNKALKLTREKALNERLAKDKALQKAKIHRQKLLNILLALGISTMLMLALFIWYHLRRQRTVNQKLQTQSQEILQQKEEIAAQRDYIEQKNTRLEHQKEEITTQRDNIELANVELQQQKEEIAAQRDNIEHQSQEIMAQRDHLISLNKNLQNERAKTEALLHNIFPGEVAQELKEGGHATPKHYDLVSVLFTDFKGFTQISEQLTPSQLVKELNYCFQAFDEIINKFDLEKIKTIGDAYMCAGGLPVPNTSNPIDTVKAGLAMIDFMERYNAEKAKKGEPVFELRIGIHTGPLVAGVIGKNKFAYDIWGDTVNLASRMESGGEIGKVNISATTYEMVKSHFNCVHRGKIHAKNKGEVDMYFVRKRSSLFQGIQNMTNSSVQVAS